jgi:hypothetical protein
MVSVARDSFPAAQSDSAAVLPVAPLDLLSTVFRESAAVLAVLSDLRAPVSGAALTAVFAPMRRSRRRIVRMPGPRV